MGTQLWVYGKGRHPALTTGDPHKGHAWRPLHWVMPEEGRKVLLCLYPNRFPLPHSPTRRKSECTVVYNWSQRERNFCGLEKKRRYEKGKKKKFACNSSILFSGWLGHLACASSINCTRKKGNWCKLKDILYIFHQCWVTHTHTHTHGLKHVYRQGCT